MTMDIDVVSTWVTIVSQLGLAAGAFRLAHQLKGRVDNHEHRIIRLERGRPKMVRRKARASK